MRGQSVDRYDTALRKGLVYTLFFYLVLGAAVGGYVLVRRVRLVWHRGSPLAALALGIPAGVLGGGLAVLLNSALRGRLAGDPNMELLVGGGGALRIFVALVVTSVAAVGGGGAPGVELPSVAVSLPARYAAALRTGEPAVAGRVVKDRCLLDLRTVRPDEDAKLREAVRRCG